jgi:hypothetical protein
MVKDETSPTQHLSIKISEYLNLFKGNALEIVHSCLGSTLQSPPPQTAWNALAVAVQKSFIGRNIASAVPVMNW